MTIKIRVYDCWRSRYVEEFYLKQYLTTHWCEWLLKSGLSGYGNYYFLINSRGEIYIIDDLGIVVEAPQVFKLRGLDIRP